MFSGDVAQRYLCTRDWRSAWYFDSLNASKPSTPVFKKHVELCSKFSNFRFLPLTPNRLAAVCRLVIFFSSPSIISITFLAYWGGLLYKLFPYLCLFSFWLFLCLFYCPICLFCVPFFLYFCLSFFVIICIGYIARLPSFSLSSFSSTFWFHFHRCFVCLKLVDSMRSLPLLFL